MRFTPSFDSYVSNQTHEVRYGVSAASARVRTSAKCPASSVKTLASLIAGHREQLYTA